MSNLFQLSSQINNQAAYPVPKRMKSFEATQQHAKLLNAASRVLKKPLVLSPTRYEEISNGLWQGDQPMDQLLDWLFSENPGQRKKLFEQALQDGVDSIKHCPDEIRQFFQLVDTVPAWVDQQKIDQALAFIAASGVNANYILRDMSLMGGYLLSGLNQALVLTGALNQGAAKRLAETSKWWIDCTSIGGLKRDGAGFKSTIHVRMIHALVRRNLNKRKEWLSDDWGLPINQIDMASTNLAFCNLYLIGLRGIGIFATPTEARAVMHFWKYLAWLMGVEEQWLVDNEVDGWVMLYQLLQSQPPADWTSKALGYALSREPLQKEFKQFGKLRQQFHYHKHLSISRYFLGRDKMQQLGLPTYILPWFPLLITPKNLLTFHVQRHLPLLRKKQMQRGRQAQLDYLAQFGGNGQHTIQPEKSHPAYVPG